MRRKRFSYQRLDLIPSAASQTAADAGHVDRAGMLGSVNSDLRKALSHGVVADGSRSASAPNTVLADHVGYGDAGRYIHKLDCTQRRMIRIEPLPVSLFWSAPALGHRENEPSAPFSGVVTYVRNGLEPVVNRPRGVTDNVVDRVRHLPLTGFRRTCPHSLELLSRHPTRAKLRFSCDFEHGWNGFEAELRPAARARSTTSFGQLLQQPVFTSDVFWLLIVRQ